MPLGTHVPVPTERPRGVRGWMLVFLVTAMLAGVLGPGTPATAHEAPGPEAPRPEAAAAEPAYLTLLFGRTQWEQRDPACSAILPNSITLGQVAQELQRRGLTGVGIVIVNWTSSTSTRTCNGRLASATWNDLATLRDTYGWTMVSGGKSHADMTAMTTQQQRAETCGSLPAFTDHGHTGAAGLFAYGNNKYSGSIQANVVSTCFSYGRKYGSGVNARTKMTAPWFQSTVSYNGGACNDLSRACSDTGTHGGYRYALPGVVRALMQPAPGQWSAVQFYRFVTGSRNDPADPTYAWNCTGSDPRLHWTTRAEIYCWEDYKAALDAIPAGVTVTDPLTVARAWGRTVP